MSVLIFLFIARLVHSAQTVDVCICHNKCPMDQCHDSNLIEYNSSYSPAKIREEFEKFLSPQMRVGIDSFSPIELDLVLFNQTRNIYFHSISENKNSKCSVIFLTNQKDYVWTRTSNFSFNSVDVTFRTTDAKPEMVELDFSIFELNLSTLSFLPEKVTSHLKAQNVTLDFDVIVNITHFNIINRFCVILPYSDTDIIVGQEKVTLKAIEKEVVMTVSDSSTFFLIYLNGKTVIKCENISEYDMLPSLTFASTSPIEIAGNWPQPPQGSDIKYKVFGEFIDITQSSPSIPFNFSSKSVKYVAKIQNATVFGTIKIYNHTELSTSLLPSELNPTVNFLGGFDVQSTTAHIHLMTPSMTVYLSNLSVFEKIKSLPFVFHFDQNSIPKLNITGTIKNVENVYQNIYMVPNFDEFQSDDKLVQLFAQNWTILVTLLDYYVYTAEESTIFYGDKLIHGFWTYANSLNSTVIVTRGPRLLNIVIQGDRKPSEIPMNVCFHSEKDGSICPDSSVTFSDETKFIDIQSFFPSSLKMLNINAVSKLANVNLSTLTGNEVNVSLAGKLGKIIVGKNSSNNIHSILLTNVSDLKGDMELGVDVVTFTNVSFDQSSTEKFNIDFSDNNRLYSDFFSLSHNNTEIKNLKELVLINSTRLTSVKFDKDGWILEGQSSSSASDLMPVKIPYSVSLSIKAAVSTNQLHFIAQPNCPETSGIVIETEHKMVFKFSGNWKETKVTPSFNLNHGMNDIIVEFDNLFIPDIKYDGFGFVEMRPDFATETKTFCVVPKENMDQCKEQCSGECVSFEDASVSASKVKTGNINLKIYDSNSTSFPSFSVSDIKYGKISFEASSKSPHTLPYIELVNDSSANLNYSSHITFQDVNVKVKNDKNTLKLYAAEIENSNFSSCKLEIIDLQMIDAKSAATFESITVDNRIILNDFDKQSQNKPVKIVFNSSSANGKMLSIDSSVGNTINVSNNILIVGNISIEGISDPEYAQIFISLTQSNDYYLNVFGDNFSYLESPLFNLSIDSDLTINDGFPQLIRNMAIGSVSFKKGGKITFRGKYNPINIISEGDIDLLATNGQQLINISGYISFGKNTISFDYDDTYVVGKQFNTFSVDQHLSFIPINNNNKVIGEEEKAQFFLKRGHTTLSADHFESSEMTRNLVLKFAIDTFNISHIHLRNPSKNFVYTGKLQIVSQVEGFLGDEVFDWITHDSMKPQIFNSPMRFFDIDEKINLPIIVENKKNGTHGFVKNGHRLTFVLDPGFPGPKSSAILRIKSAVPSQIPLLMCYPKEECIGSEILVDDSEVDKFFSDELPSLISPLLKKLYISIRKPVSKINFETLNPSGKLTVVINGSSSIDKLELGAKIHYIGLINTTLTEDLLVRDTQMINLINVTTINNKFITFENATIDLNLSKELTTDIDSLHYCKNFNKVVIKKLRIINISSFTIKDELSFILKGVVHKDKDLLINIDDISSNTIYYLSHHCIFHVNDIIETLPKCTLNTLYPDSSIEFDSSWSRSSIIPYDFTINYGDIDITLITQYFDFPSILYGQGDIIIKYRTGNDPIIIPDVPYEISGDDSFTYDFSLGISKILYSKKTIVHSGISELLFSPETDGVFQTDEMIIYNESDVTFTTLEVLTNLKLDRETYLQTNRELHVSRADIVYHWELNHIPYIGFGLKYKGEDYKTAEPPNSLKIVWNATIDKFNKTEYRRRLFNRPFEIVETSIKSTNNMNNSNNNNFDDDEKTFCEKWIRVIKFSSPGNDYFDSTYELNHLNVFNLSCKKTNETVSVVMTMVRDFTDYDPTITPTFIPSFSPTPTSADDDGKSKFGAPYIIGITIGGIVVIALIIAMVFVMKKKMLCCFKPKDPSILSALIEPKYVDSQV